MKTYQEAIQAAEDMGMVDGEITLVIVNGEFVRAEYLIRTRIKRKQVDAAHE